ncbi:uncharacterized protein DNG_06688 [Cephalotrichum gorgonifer]|uniref:Uncharacterized protein n=1 Tax=Cephalotrichum gorgonifer TaxID=2041049 RepID=A0AAE8SWN8_9PEZI|nr:uncharacterized protein DNG_06688 [Cephalotrichum gorgonifer]
MDPFSDQNAVISPVSPQSSEVDPFSDRNAVVNPVPPQGSEMNPFSDQNATNGPVSPHDPAMDLFSDHNAASNPDSPQEADIAHLHSHDKTIHPASNTDTLAHAPQSLLTISWFHHIPDPHLLSHLFHDAKVRSSLSKLADAAITATDDLSSPAIWRLARDNFVATADGDPAEREPSTHLRRLATYLANLVNSQDNASRAPHESQSGREAHVAATIAARLREVEDRRAELVIPPWGDKAKTWAVCCGLFAAFVYEVEDALDEEVGRAVWRARGVAETFAFTTKGDE